MWDCGYLLEIPVIAGNGVNYAGNSGESGMIVGYS